jgi:hypothetical protein
MNVDNIKLFMNKKVLAEEYAPLSAEPKVIFTSGDTYVLPVRCKLLLKKLHKMGMQVGEEVVVFTFLLWIYLKDVSEEIRESLRTKIKYRIGFGLEEEFSQDNSAIREKMTS